MELATMTCFTIQPNTNKKGKWPGKPVHFHAHLALEPKCSFMLILQLDNAKRPPQAVRVVDSQSDSNRECGVSRFAQRAVGEQPESQADRGN
jgi:hypothetical protein